MPTAPSGMRPSSTLRPESQPASGLPRPTPSATVPTTTLVFNSSQRGFWLSPSMYTVARMKATMKVKKAMPMTAKASGRDAQERLQIAEQRAVQIGGEVAASGWRRASGE